MAHFAKLDANNFVEEVIVVNDSDTGGGNLDTESVGIAVCQNHWKETFGVDGTNWKQTSYNNNFRGNYAGIGFTYMTGVRTLGVASTDIFIQQQPAASWSIGINTATWYPPDNPGSAPILTEAQYAEGKWYAWNESNYEVDPSTAWVLCDTAS